ncbi:MAG TPA: PA2779 family protein [Acidobacteriaceae bacterium]|jgi:pyruvate/2-oxoglutarate dehydrogenase complex dihydrolipoamide acyltransferase (E2) component|nr:PA2779 family protein [Acidobacteriaceae bacterium]
MHYPRIFRLVTRSLAAVALPLLLASSPAVRAQDTHLVSPSQMQQQVQSATAARQQNIESLNQFLATPAAQKAMKDAKIDPAQVKNAVPTLSNAELASLSARAAHAQSQFAAGGLTTLALALIIIAVVLIILLAAYH